MADNLHTLGAAGVALLILALGSWVLLMLVLASVLGKEVHGDAAFGQGVAWLAAMVLAGLTWLWIGGLLLKAGTQGMLPSAGVALGLELGWGAAMAAAVFLLQDSNRVWPVAIPALIPPILSFYVFALYQPSLRPALAGTAGTVAVWGAVLVLSALAGQSAVVQLMVRRSNRIETREAGKQWDERERQRKRAENLTKLQAMSPEAPVWEWIPYLNESSGVREEALAAVRHLKSRQTDIQAMLDEGFAPGIVLLPDLDLKATPELCQAARAYLIKTAKSSRVRPKQDPRAYQSGDFVETSLRGIRWLIENGCECSDAIAAMRASVETFLDTPDRRAALAALAALDHK